MSHGRERKEKDCLNCGTIVQGRFCQTCGQENIEPKETFWGMFTHFFNDITHFDGKFFTTLKDLLFKPGFLSAEYMRGRRMSYLNPIRMYVFTSALFFLVFFSLRQPSEMVHVDSSNEPMTAEQRQKRLEKVNRYLSNDSANKLYQKEKALLMDTTKPVSRHDIDQIYDSQLDLPPIGTAYNSLAEYDSVQAAVPEKRRDGWFTHLYNKKIYKLNDQFKSNRQAAVEKIVEVFLHKLPYLLFASLPFFALILKLLYIRGRKVYYYADHGIFSIHHYIFSFILLLFALLVGKLTDATGWYIWDILVFIALIAWPVHLFIAMRRFYGQRKLKTFLKFVLLNLLGFISLIFLFVLFALFSFFQL